MYAKVVDEIFVLLFHMERYVIYLSKVFILAHPRREKGFEVLIILK